MSADKSLPLLANRNRENEDSVGHRTRFSTAHPFATALVVLACCLLCKDASAAHHVAQVSLSASEAQPDEPIIATVRITAVSPLVGHVRVVVIDTTTGLRVYRTRSHVRLRKAGTKDIPITIPPMPASASSYKLVATLFDDAWPDPNSLAKAAAEFSVPVANPSVAQLPFWMRYCKEPTCGGLQRLVVRVCPTSNPSCSPHRQTTVVPRLDGHQINQIFFPVQAPVDVTATLESGSGSVISTLVFSYTSPVIVRSDVDVTLSYYHVTPVWGGITNLDFVSEITSSPEVVTTVYHHPTFLINGEATQLHEQGRNIISVESQIAGINPGQMHAFFMPSEFATDLEGNFSDGALNVYMNYGNPPYIAALGSVYDVVMPRFAHEYVHELFSEVSLSHPGNSVCLNEGLADAFSFAAGFLPEVDFGPLGQHGADFNQGCAGIGQNPSPEIHEAGNCPLWQVHRQGLLSQSFATGVLRPQHAIEFDSCNLASPQTGNALLVLFSDAAGRDMTGAIDMAQIPNAGSLQAAKQALGIQP